MAAHLDLIQLIVSEAFCTLRRMSGPYADKILNVFKIVWCKSLNISISEIIYQLSRSRYVAGVGFRNPCWTEMKPLGVTGWFKWSSDLNDCFLWSASVRSQSANSYYSVPECVCVCLPLLRFPFCLPSITVFLLPPCSQSLIPSVLSTVFFKVVLVPINSSISPAVHSGLFLVTLWDLEEKQIQGTMFGWLLKISASHGQVIIWCDPSEPISRALFRFIYFTLCFCSNCSYLQPQIWVQNLVHY